jgi:hypothetical protein
VVIRQLFDRRKQVAAGRRLRHKCRRADFEGSLTDILIVHRREYDDFRGWMPLPDLTTRLEVVHTRQVEVDDNHIGLQSLRCREQCDRVTFVWGDDLSLPEILRRSARLPDHSAILFLSFGTDAAGAAYADERVLGDLNTTARAPVFGLQSTYLGAGVVGGSLLRIVGSWLRTSASSTRRSLTRRLLRVRQASRPKGR